MLDNLSWYDVLYLSLVCAIVWSWLNHREDTKAIREYLKKIAAKKPIVVELAKGLTAEFKDEKVTKDKVM